MTKKNKQWKTGKIWHYLKGQMKYESGYFKMAYEMNNGLNWKLANLCAWEEDVHNELRWN